MNTKINQFKILKKQIFNRQWGHSMSMKTNQSKQLKILIILPEIQ